jgi:uncharacterized membrane protein
MAKTMVTRHPIEWIRDALYPAGHVRDVRPFVPQTVPAIRRIEVAELAQVLRLGTADFMACRSDAILLCIIYPIAGLVMSRLVIGYDIIPLVFPLVAGFALLGPVLATGLYELSRRREIGEPVHWAAAFAPFSGPAIGSMVALGLGLLAIFGLWMLAASLLYDATLGPKPPVSAAAFLHDVLHTGPGLLMAVLGIGIGAVFAATVFAVSVVSFPMLLDRDCGVAIAIRTSLQVVRTNPRPMALWGLIVAGGLLAASIPFLVGLAIVLPILGHATWHLYKRLIRPSAESQTSQ